MTDSSPKARRFTSEYRVGWNQIRSGMKHTEVLSLLDEPMVVKVTRVNTYWYYSDRGAKGPYVVLDTSAMTVDRWQTPEPQ
jgi:outer membrane protein assembly factor BamE (lipoprotein component of BamABCDE complex)